MPPAGEARRPRTDGPATGGGRGRGSARPIVVSNEGAEKAPRRLAMGNWHIRTRLAALLVLPVVAAIVLGALRIQDSMQTLGRLNDIANLTQLTESSLTLASSLQDERDVSAGPISEDPAAGRGKTTDPQVKLARNATDQAKLKYEQQVSSVKSQKLGGTVEQTVNSVERQLAKLDSTRQSAYGDSISTTVNAYSTIIDPLLSLPRDVIQDAQGGDLVPQAHTLQLFSTEMENASIQRAIIAGALGRKHSSHAGIRKQAFPQNERLAAQNASAAEDAARSDFQSSGGARAKQLLAPLSGSEMNPAVRLADLHTQQMLSDTAYFKNTDKTWRNWYEEVRAKIDLMQKIQNSLVSDVSQKAKELRANAQRDAIINSAVIAAVLLVGVLGALAMARSMVRSLRKLQRAAEDVAGNRLPQLVRQLAESDPQDVDLTVRSIGLNTREEFGAVGRAFDDVHREAVRLAAEQALLRGNINAMFTNLSRRSQGLIQRQITLISELESREADPDQLSSLFKLDHLATRMRRNGENLLVLAGEEPGRRWTRPVPLVDVLRAAASEVEQYERIELGSVPQTDVIGRVVNDLVHLLAELLENATSFSSPQTRVKVTGNALPDGRVLVEVHDTGIGLSPEDLAEVNERLANPPVVDVSVSRRMGLFVVGRLSTRHGIRIQLRPSDSGGTTALVMLPLEVTGRGPAGSRGGRPGAKAAPGGPGAQAGTAVPPARPGGAGGRPGLPGAANGASNGASNTAANGPGTGATTGTGLGALPRRATGSSNPPAAGDGGRTPLPGRRPGANGPAAPGTSAPAPGTAPAPSAQAPAAQAEQAPAARGGAPGSGGPRRPQPPLPRRAETPDRGDERTLRPGSGRPSGERPALPGQPSDTGSTGANPLPGIPGVRRPDGGATAPAEARNSPAAPAPQAPAAPQAPQAPQPPRAPESEGPELPGRDGARPGASGGMPRRVGGDAPAGGIPPQRPVSEDPLGLDPADLLTGPLAPGAVGAERLPIFDEMESAWFQGAPEPAPEHSVRPPWIPEEPPAAQPQAPAAPEPEPEAPQPQAPAPESAPEAEPEPEAPARPEPRIAAPRIPEPQYPEPQFPEPQEAGEPAGDPRLATPGTSPAPGPATSPDETVQFGAVADREQAPGSNLPWRTSANDERWRQAEAVRRPQADGTTPSGLPRRVPRANLVPGNASESNQNGPSVSRNPDAVRGRLTNLRRGIQQARGDAEGHGPNPQEQQQ